MLTLLLLVGLDSSVVDWSGRRKRISECQLRRNEFRPLNVLLLAVAGNGTVPFTVCRGSIMHSTCAVV